MVGSFLGKCVLSLTLGSQAELGELRMGDGDAGWRQQKPMPWAAGSVERSSGLTFVQGLLVLLHHCTHRNPDSHSPSVGWDGHSRGKHRSVSLVSKLRVHSGGG